MSSRITFGVQALFLGIFLFATLARAAEGGQGEIAGFGGVARLSDGGGSHAIAGGTVGVNIGRVIHLFGEFNYIPLGSASETTSYQGIAIHASATAKMLNYGGGLHFRVPTGTSKVEPYFVTSFGYGHQSVTGNGSANYQGTPVSVSMDLSQGNAYVGFGGGLRYFVGHRWGVKPEFRYQKYFGDGAGSIITASGGLFLQFGGQ